jgi:hypothetical protein
VQSLRLSEYAASGARQLDLACDAGGTKHPLSCCASRDATHQLPTRCERKRPGACQSGRHETSFWGLLPGNPPAGHDPRHAQLGRLLVGVLWVWAGEGLRCCRVRQVERRHCMVMAGSGARVSMGLPHTLHVSAWACCCTLPAKSHHYVLPPTLPPYRTPPQLGRPAGHHPPPGPAVFCGAAVGGPPMVQVGAQRPSCSVHP